MTYLHINYVRDHSQTKGMVRLLPFAIAIRTNEQGCAWPGYERLARDTKMSIRSVRRALLEISSDELAIRQGGSPKGQRRQPNVYQILISSNPTAIRITRTVGDAEDEPDPARNAHGAAQNHDHDLAHTQLLPNGGPQQRSPGGDEPHEILL